MNPTIENEVSPRQEPRLTIALDQETLDRIKEMAEQDERPLGRQILILLRATIELIDEQGFSLLEGKLRKVTVEDPSQSDLPNP